MKALTFDKILFLLMENITISFIPFRDEERDYVKN